MKKTMLKGFAAGMLVVLAALIPAACRKKPPVVAPTNTQTTSTVSDVTTREIPVPTTTTDFVRETPEPPRPTATELPAEIEAANREAQARGYIRDAFFSYDESTLTADGQAALTTTATWLRQNPRYNLLIEGHCDERGTEQYNLALGDRRANTAREFLIALGVEGSRLRTVSYGEERPFDEGHDESSWMQNRRAHLVLVSR
jgi:peptidoglycan-associated lipoprotein